MNNQLQNGLYHMQSHKKEHKLLLKEYTLHTAFVLSKPNICDLMPSTPCDKFVYDFLCDLGGIVGGYGLRRMCSHCLRVSCDFFYGASGTTRGKSVYRDCAEIVRKSSNVSAVAVQSP